MSFPGLAPGPHVEFLRQALTREASAQQDLLAHGIDRSADAFADASRLYLQSYEVAPPGSYGRLIGALKAAVLSGDHAAARDVAARAVEAASGAEPSPTVGYVRALASLVAGDAAGTVTGAQLMRAGDGAFARAAAALTALATGDRAAYADAIAGIVADFESRNDHLTGVAIADTAAMLEMLAETRGMACRERSDLLPVI